MTQRKIYRQGDVLLVETTEKLKNVKPEQRDGRGRLILAAGEATGHHHAIQQKNATIVAGLLAGVAIRMLQLEEAAELVHEEHGTIVLPPGDYQIIRQQEYTPRGIREVLD